MARCAYYQGDAVRGRSNADNCPRLPTAASRVDITSDGEGPFRQPMAKGWHTRIGPGRDLFGAWRGEFTNFARYRFQYHTRPCGVCISTNHAFQLRSHRLVSCVGYVKPDGFARAHRQTVGVSSEWQHIVLDSSKYLMFYGPRPCCPNQCLN